MAKVLSISSKLRTGLYRTTRTMFFTQSKLLEAQITEVFDELWPTVTAFKLLRWQVRGYYEECSIDNNTRLTSKFVEPEDKSNRPNLYRMCVEESWADMEYRIAKNLLTNIFACYENWAASICKALQLPRDACKWLQFPNTTRNNYQSVLNYMAGRGNQDIITAFYDTYKTKNRNYNINKLNNWILLYRYYKECRNAIIHNGGQTTQNLINAYNSVCQFTAQDLDVEESPNIIQTNIGDPIQLSLRSVVGFSEIVLKIVSTLDVEFIKGPNVDSYVATHILNEIKHMFPTEQKTLQKNVNNVVQRGFFQKPGDVMAAYRVLTSLHVMR